MVVRNREKGEKDKDIKGDRKEIEKKKKKIVKRKEKTKRVDIMGFRGLAYWVLGNWHNGYYRVCKMDLRRICRRIVKMILEGYLLFGSIDDDILEKH
eukprot:1005178-Amorphochlora_amoeboformis.AAC.1